VIKILGPTIQPDLTLEWRIGDNTFRIGDEIKLSANSVQETQTHIAPLACRRTTVARGEGHPEATFGFYSKKKKKKIFANKNIF